MEDKDGLQVLQCREVVPHLEIHGVACETPNAAAVDIHLYGTQDENEYTFVRVLLIQDGLVT